MKIFEHNPHVNVLQPLHEPEINSDGVVLQFLPWCEADGFRFTQRKLSEESAKRLAFQLLSAVRHCHRNGVVHRDLKPENVLIRVEPDGKKYIKLADFGACYIRDEIRNRASSPSSPSLPMSPAATVLPVPSVSLLPGSPMSLLSPVPSPSPMMSPSERSSPSPVSLMSPAELSNTSPVATASPTEMSMTSPVSLMSPVELTDTSPVALMSPAEAYNALPVAVVSPVVPIAILSPTASAVEVGKGPRLSAPAPVTAPTPRLPHDSATTEHPPSAFRPFVPAVVPEDNFGNAGTMAYMAPEYASRAGQVYDWELLKKLDVWSVGASMYVMMFGALPPCSQEPEYRGLYSLWVDAYRSQDYAAVVKLLEGEVPCRKVACKRAEFVTLQQKKDGCSCRVISPDVAHFFAVLLNPNPYTRCTIEEAMNHKWLKSPVGAV